MKNTKKTTEEFLERLRGLTKKLQKSDAGIAKISQDKAAIEATIAAIGTPRYDDDAAIAALTKAERKLQLCEKALADASEKAGEAASSQKIKDEMYSLLVEGGGLAAELLAVIAQRRLQTVTASVRPYSDSQESAVKLAERSDACRQAAHCVAVYQTLSNNLLGPEPLPGFLSSAAKIETVLTESLKDAPDYMKLFAFDSGWIESETAAGAVD